MPLYKITEKRLANRAREDSEGITALKAEIGLGTGSSSGGDSGSESEGSGKSDGESELQMDDEGDTSSDDDAEEDEENGLVSSGKVGEKPKRPDGDNGDKKGRVEADPFPITVETALESPIYPLLSSPGEHVLHACVLCPRKKMKTDDMVDDHLASQPHLRARKRWVERIQMVKSRPLPSSDPREVAMEILERVEQQRSMQLQSPARARRKGKESPADTAWGTEQLARRAQTTEKAVKRERDLGSIPSEIIEIKRRARGERPQKRAEKTQAMRTARIGGGGKGRSPKMVRKEKKALRTLDEGGEAGTGTNAGKVELVLNRMARRMIAAGRGVGQKEKGDMQRT